MISERNFLHVSLLGGCAWACTQSDLFAQEFVVWQALTVSDYAPGATEVLPRLAAGDSHATCPLISLIVPVWNDDELVVDLVSGLQFVPELAEWVVAAVQPGERLFELHRQGMVRLISCDKPSRGRQMNAGAAEARGSLLCFHHADSELRPEHLSALEKAARNEAILGGAFHRYFDNRRTFVVWWEGLIRRVNSFAGPLFGDQSIFVRSSVFERMGGFADIPLMEDIEFSRRLRRLGSVVLLDPPLWSSPRRFHRLGNWRTTLLNMAFIGLFYLGVDPCTLHRWYYGWLRGFSIHGIGVDPVSRGRANQSL
jgi:rSAM/selenodomain-associated transferase 2